MGSDPFFSRDHFLQLNGYTKLVIKRTKEDVRKKSAFSSKSSKHASIAG